MDLKSYIIPYSELTIDKARAGCFVIGMPNEEYHAYEGISNSGLKLVGQSPAHFAFQEPQKQSDAKRIGSAVHCALLEPDVFTSQYLLLPEAKDRRVAIFNQAAKTTDKEFILVEREVAHIEGMRDSWSQNRAVQSYLDCEYWTELSGFIECPETGALLRIRFDLLNARCEALDVKKTQDARSDAFSKSIYNYGYHHQAAFYNDVFELITGTDLAKFSFFAVEEKTPNASKVYRLDEVAMIMGRDMYKSNLETYAHCEKTGNWPKYDDTEELISVPDWALFKEENDIAGEIV